METYNGHKNWTHWNVALWVCNDESIYLEASRLLAKFPGKLAKCARLLKRELPERTPDGARYSLIALRASLEGWT